MKRHKLNLKFKKKTANKKLMKLVSVFLSVLKKQKAAQRRGGAKYNEYGISDGGEDGVKGNSATINYV